MEKDNVIEYITQAIGDLICCRDDYPKIEKLSVIALLLEIKDMVKKL